MDLSKEYYSDGIKCNILEMLNREPEWAANRLQEGEKYFEELCQLRNAHNQPSKQTGKIRCKKCGRVVLDFAGIVCPLCLPDFSAA